MPHPEGTTPRTRCRGFLGSLGRTLARAWLAAIAAVAILGAPAGSTLGQQLTGDPEALLLNFDAGSLSVNSGVVTYTAEAGVVRDVSCSYAGDPAIYVDVDTSTGRAPDLLGRNGSFGVNVHCTAADPGSYSGTVTCTYSPAGSAGGTAESVETLVDCDVDAGPAVQLGSAVVKPNGTASVAIGYVASPAAGPDSIVSRFVAEIGLGEGGLPLPDLSACGGELGGLDVVCSFGPQGSVLVETEGFGGPNLPGGSLGSLAFKVPKAVNVASSYELPVTLETFGPNQTQPSAVGNRSGFIHVTPSGSETLAASPSQGMAVFAMAGARSPDYSSPLVGSTTLTAFGDVSNLGCELSGGVPELTFGSLEATPLPPFIISGGQQQLEVSCDRRTPGRYTDTLRCGFGGNRKIDLPVDCAVLQGPALVLGSDVADPGQAATIPINYVAGEGRVSHFTAIVEPPETAIGAPDLSNCGGSLGGVTVTCSLGASNAVRIDAPASGSGGPLPGVPLPSGSLGSVTYDLPTTLATPYVFALGPEAQLFDATGNEVPAVGNEVGHVGCVCGGDALVPPENPPAAIDLTGTIASGVVTGSQSLLSVADLTGLSCGVASGGDPQISLAPPSPPLPSKLGAGQTLDLEARCLAAEPGTYSATVRCDYTSVPTGTAASTGVPVSCVIDGGPAVQVTSAEIRAGGSTTLDLSYVADPAVVSFAVEVTYDTNFLAVGDLSACGGADTLGVGVTCDDDGGVVRLTTDAAASDPLPDGPLGSITFDQVGVIQPGDLPLALETGFNNQKYFDADNQEVSPIGSVAGEIQVVAPPMLSVEPTGIRVAGVQGTSPTAGALFTVEAVQIPAGDLDCSQTGDPQLSAVSSYPFLSGSAPNLARGNTFTVTFGCDTSSTGTYTGNYLCVAAGDGGAGVQVDLPVTCTVN